MRKIREILRLKSIPDTSNRTIAKACNIGRGSVAEYLRRAKVAGLSWPLPEGLDDEQIEALLFPPQSDKSIKTAPLPNWSYIDKELRRKGVTRALLWEEYKAATPDGLMYTQFCSRYLKWRGGQNPVMRQIHKAGEKLFIDYAGQTVPIIDRHTGEVRFAEIFVTVLGAGSYTYCEATWTQTLPDWISSHVRAFEFYGGLPEVLVPDNLKSGVTKAHIYEPDLNKTYQDMATHYEVAVVPARALKPKDKAKVESGVQVSEMWILARLRNQDFFSLEELNQAIAKLLPELNNRPFQKREGCRRSMFEALDKEVLRPLPAHRYQYGEWIKARVNVDYHVQVEGHYYSVPYTHLKSELDVRITAMTVEMFRKNRRVASHVRNRKKYGYTTLIEHMPDSHKHYAEWSVERLVGWAQEAGGQTAEVITRIIESRPLPQQGFRPSLGIMNLGKSYGMDRLEAACNRALAINALTYKSIKSILKSGLDSQPVPGQEGHQIELAIDHKNIRGAQYYQSSGKGEK